MFFDIEQCQTTQNMCRFPSNMAACTCAISKHFQTFWPDSFQAILNKQKILYNTENKLSII